MVGFLFVLFIPFIVEYHVARKAMTTEDLVAMVAAAAPPVGHHSLPPHQTQTRKIGSALRRASPRHHFSSVLASFSNQLGSGGGGVAMSFYLVSYLPALRDPVPVQGDLCAQRTSAVMRPVGRIPGWGICKVAD